MEFDQIELGNFFVIPAKAGIHRSWTPACAGVTIGAFQRSRTLL